MEARLAGLWRWNEASEGLGLDAVERYGRLIQRHRFGRAALLSFSFTSGLLVVF
jgi:hypothetical protein